MVSSRKRVSNHILLGLVAFPGHEALAPGDDHDDATREAERSSQGTILAADDCRPGSMRPARPGVLPAEGPGSSQLSILASGARATRRRGRIGSGRQAPRSSGGAGAPFGVLTGTRRAGAS